MFISELFTIAKIEKQSIYLSVGEWIKNVVHLHNGILCSRENEGAPTLCNSIDGPEDYYSR